VFEHAPNGTLDDLIK
jgi:serine/threonine protein kinase